MKGEGLDERIVQFGRLLRDNGFTVTPHAMADALRVLVAAPGAPSQADLRDLLQLLLCKRGDERSRFHEIFDAYWLNQVGRKQTLLSESAIAAKAAVERNQRTGTQTIPPGLASYFEWRNGQGSEQQDQDREVSAPAMAGACGVENRRTVDFGRVTDPEEAEALLALAERIGRRLRHRLSRRRQPAHKGRAVDLRRTLRHAVTTGGLPFRLAHQRRRTPPVSLVIFVDVSGSMDAYSLFFARFAQALMRGFRDVHAFLFHTSLVHVSDVFREARAEVLMDKMSLIGQGWSGGTQIGDSLERFNLHYGRRVGGSRTVALLMSDGYDAGSAHTLAQGLRTLKRYCRKLIWLNPLAGRAAYEPTASGARQLQAMADVVAPAHNLASLAAVEEAIFDV